VVEVTAHDHHHHRWKCARPWCERRSTTYAPAATSRRLARTRTTHQKGKKAIYHPRSTFAFRFGFAGAGTRLGLRSPRRGRARRRRSPRRGGTQRRWLISRRGRAGGKRFSLYYMLFSAATTRRGQEGASLEITKEPRRGGRRRRQINNRCSST